MNPKLITFFDSKAKERDYWIKRNSYYNKELIKFFKNNIPRNRTVLEIGSGTGFLLNELAPKNGVGLDFSKEMVALASQKYPHLKFIHANASDYSLKASFDFIIISDTIGYFEDIQEVFKQIRQNCTNKTRIIITYYNYLWEPFLKLAEKLSLKMKQPFTSWLSSKDICSLLNLEEFDVVKSGKRFLMPKYIPLISSFCNRYLVNFPFFKNLGLVDFIIARPLNVEKVADKTVSIIVPARNESGNIEKVVTDLSVLGKKTEIIFVEGHSQDNTWEEIERVAKKYKNKDIKFVKQCGKGKGDAVRKGFDIAKGDLLFIYDADMSVPAKDIYKFYEAIVLNKGEFINGSRLIYPMERQAMRLLNLFGNKVFSLIFSWLLDQRIKDTLCGTKVLSRVDYEFIKENRSYFSNFDPFGDFDLLFGASKQNLKIVEIPIRYKERNYGNTNIQRFMHGWLLLKMCIFAIRRIKFV